MFTSVILLSVPPCWSSHLASASNHTTLENEKKHSTMIRGTAKDLGDHALPLICISSTSLGL